MLFSNKKGKQSLNYQPIQSDVKRSTTENINKNTNQIVQTVIPKPQIAFDLKQTNIGVSESINTPPKPPPNNISIVHKSVAASNIDTKKKIKTHKPIRIEKHNDLTQSSPHIMHFDEKKLQHLINAIVNDNMSRQQDKQPSMPKITPDQIKSMVEKLILDNKTKPEEMKPIVEKMILDNKTNPDEIKSIVEKMVLDNKTKPDEIQSIVEKMVLDNKTKPDEIKSIVEKLIASNTTKPEQIKTIVERYVLDNKTKPEEIKSIVENSLKDHKQEMEEHMNLIIDEKVESKVDSKMNKTIIGPIVESYLTNLIKEESLVLLDNDEEDDDDIPKTTFEEMIEPAVARIIQRVMKYDFSQQKDTYLPKSEGLNIDINYNEVYDYETREKKQFEETIKPSHPGMYNPMYNTPDSPPKSSDSSQVLELATVYKAEDKILYENELRSDTRASRKWVRFGNGVEKGNVLDMILDKKSQKIYIVGHFKHVNRIPMNNVALYDIRKKMWENVGDGIPTLATCVAIDSVSQILYIGGVFTKVGKGDKQISAQNIASYHILENRWESLGDGLNRDCNALVYDEKECKLYAGGTFTHSGSKPVHYIGVYDCKTKMWSPLEGGEVNGPCRCLLKTNDNDLYMGGLFTHAGKEDIHVSYVARYDVHNHMWSDLNGGLQGYCNTLAYDEKDDAVYVGGTFNSVGPQDMSQDAHHVAKYIVKESKWGLMNGGVNNVVFSLCYDPFNRCLYVGGNFTHNFDSDIVLNHIAKYTPESDSWSSLDNHFPNCKIPADDIGNDNVGLNGVCKVMNMDEKSLFVAGNFQIAGSITANSIVRYILGGGGGGGTKVPP
jgi:hypothetical protein